MSPSSWIVDQFQALLHMGAAELPVRCRLHWEKESITEMWRPEIYMRHLSNWIFCKLPRYALVIPTIPPEFPFLQILARCDFFRTSLKIEGTDICMVVGDSPTT